jgi:PKD domain-containing protein
MPSVPKAVAASVLLLPLYACEPSTLPTQTVQLTCSLEVERADTWAHLRATLTGGERDTTYATTVDFGDGSTEARLLRRDANELFSHHYPRNGQFTIQATARNEESSDRYTCTKSVEFDLCRSSVVLSEDFGSSFFWTRDVASDDASIREAASWQEAGGNPGGFLSMTHEFTATTSPTFVSIFVHHLYQFGGPEAGPIDRIRYSEDRIKLAPSSTAAAVGAGAVILQNGVYHRAPLTGGQFANTGWERAQATLRASDFTPVPDFSRDAPRMSFGFYRSNSNRFPLLIQHGIDNWRVEICR